MTFLLGRQAMFGHEPPTYLRSITATRCPLLAKVHAASVPPVPPPRITKSYSSTLSFCPEGVFWVVLMRFNARCNFANAGELLVSRRRFASYPNTNRSRESAATVHLSDFELVLAEWSCLYRSGESVIDAPSEMTVNNSEMHGSFRLMSPGRACGIVTTQFASVAGFSGE